MTIQTPLFNEKPSDGSMTIEDVEVGIPFYMVHALGADSFLTKMIPTSKPYINERIDSLWIDIDHFMSDGSIWHTDHSLQDMGIVPNTYNKHKCFLNEQDAQEYFKEAKKEKRELKPSYGWFSGDYYV